MNQLTCGRRLATLCAVVMMLQGCAAATVVRTEPDFEEEQRQRLMQIFPIVPVADSRMKNRSVPIEQSVARTSSECLAVNEVNGLGRGTKIRCMIM